jgi:AcrR family transcriptional regulator
MAGSPPQRRGDKTAEALRKAAIRLFFEHGYEATTLRHLAAETGITVGSVYNHIDSKEDLLNSIMSGIMRDLLDGMDTALAGVEGPGEQMRTAIEFHVLFHAERAQEVFVGNSELRSLPPVRRAAVIEARDSYEKVFRKILEDGVRAKVFYATDVRLVTYGILAMGTHVADWYRPGGRLSLEEIASVYSDFALRGLTNASAQVALGELLLRRAAA